MRPLLTCAKVCELLDVSPSTLTRLIQRNAIPHVVISKGQRKTSVRFREDELERWIERRSRGPVPPKKIAANPSTNGSTATVNE